MVIRKNGKRSKLLPATALATSIVFALTGCFLIEGPKPDAPERKPVEVTDEAAVLVPGGSAEDNRDFFVMSLKEFADSEQDISGKNITGTLIDAGFEPEFMQVTFDESKTNLPADTITVSVLVEEQCLLGQVERRSRSVYIDQAEALGPNKNICLLGNTADF